MKPLSILMLAVLVARAPATLAQTPGDRGTPTPTAIARMSEPGPEARGLAARVGAWDVVFTIWPAPGAERLVATGLIAERTMIGPFLQEVMRPAGGSATPDFRRVDYLGYDRVEGRWEYVSMDTRFPVGIMPASSFGGESNDRLTLHFDPVAFPGFGPEVEGRHTRSDLVITRQGPDRELKQQHFIQADGSGVAWLAVQYEYTRRK